MIVVTLPYGGEQQWLQWQDSKHSPTEVTGLVATSEAAAAAAGAAVAVAIVLVFRERYRSLFPAAAARPGGGQEEGVSAEGGKNALRSTGGCCTA